MDGLRCYGDELIGVNNIFDFDPSKLIVRVSDTGLSGYEANSIISDQYKIEAEFTDFKHIIFSLTIADTELSVDKLLDALCNLISRKHQINNYDDSSIKPPNGLPRSAISSHDAYFSTKTRTVPLNEAVGHILPEKFISYPAGVPLLIVKLWNSVI